MQMNTGAPYLLDEALKHSPFDKAPLPLSFSVFNCKSPQTLQFYSKLPSSHKQTIYIPKNSISAENFMLVKTNLMDKDMMSK